METRGRVGMGPMGEKVQRWYGGGGELENFDDFVGVFVNIFFALYKATVERQVQNCLIN